MLEKIETETTTEVTKTTYQQNLVIKGLRELFAATKAANIENDNRAEKMALVAGGIVAFVGGASALATGSISSYPFTALAIASVFALAIAIFRQCAKVWGPGFTAYPTVPDPDTLYMKYIAQNVHDAYNQHLVSLAACITDNKQVNETKAKMIENILRLLQLQILAVAISVALKSFGL